MALDPNRRSASSGAAGLRIGDAEREQAVQSLGEHLRAGRLTVAEYDERLEQAFTARTEAELTPLFADLPGGSPRSAVSPPPSRSERRPYRTVSIPLRLIVVLIAAAIVASGLVLFPALLLIPLLWFVVIRRFGPHRGYGRRRYYGPRNYDYSGPRRY